MANFHNIVAVTLAPYKELWSEGFHDYERVVRRYATDLQERLERYFPHGLISSELFEYLEEEIEDNYAWGEGWQATVAIKVLEALRVSETEEEQ